MRVPADPHAPSPCCCSRSPRCCSPDARHRPRPTPTRRRRVRDAAHADRRACRSRRSSRSAPRAAGDGYRIGDGELSQRGPDDHRDGLPCPTAPGPFPGVVVVHGGVDPATFTTGSDLVREQENLALSGHVVFATDCAASADRIPTRATTLDMNVGQILDVVNAGRALAASGIPSLDAGADRALRPLARRRRIDRRHGGRTRRLRRRRDDVARQHPHWWMIDHY